MRIGEYIRSIINSCFVAMSKYNIIEKKKKSCFDNNSSIMYHVEKKHAGIWKRN